jgi:hypothetical protein
MCAVGISIVKLGVFAVFFPPFSDQPDKINVARVARCNISLFFRGSLPFSLTH